MKVLISGASGLIGCEISHLLQAKGHEVHSFIRNPSKARPGDLLWQPGLPLAASALGEFDAVVHLAGRPIATLWTAKTKEEIRRSRIEGTVTVARAVTESFQKSGMPRALICASAIGYYGSRGEEELAEDNEPGLGFLAELCRQWEAAAEPAAMAGVRVAHLRISLVLSPKGGALGKMLSVFRLGVAGKLGNGRQWWSWVTLHDAARAFVFAVEGEHIHGALNLAAPGVVRNSEFTRTLGRVLHRPTLLRVPDFLLRTLAGEMAQETMLASQRVVPAKLLETGFRFEDPELEPALRKLLN